MNAGQAAYEAHFAWQQCAWCNRVRTGHAPRGWRTGTFTPVVGEHGVACMGCVRSHRLIAKGWVLLRHVCLLPLLADYGPGNMVYNRAVQRRFAQGLVQP